MSQSKMKLLSVKAVSQIRSDKIRRFQPLIDAKAALAAARAAFPLAKLEEKRAFEAFKLLKDPRNPVGKQKSVVNAYEARCQRARERVREAYEACKTAHDAVHQAYHEAHAAVRYAIEYETARYNATG